MRKRNAIASMIFTVGLGLSASIHASASEFPRPELIQILSEKVFTPTGFDDNDNAQIVIHGNLINTCHKAAPPRVRVDLGARKIHVTARNYLYTGCWCLNVLVPYTQSVDLGVLPAGSYQVVEADMQGNSLSRGTLVVGGARGPAPDELLYAPVSQSALDRRGARPELVLSGVFPSDCMYLEEVRTVHRRPDVVEVLPIAGYKSNVICQGTPRPFEARVALPDDVQGSTLIHVRSLNGQAVNRVEDL